MAFEKNDVTTFIETRGTGRNAPEASAGVPFRFEDPQAFPPEEAGGIFPASRTENSPPYDSKRADQAPGPCIPLALVPLLFKEPKDYLFLRISSR